MQIKLFGMKARVELLVLILLLGLYLGSTMLCNCMRYEGMANMGSREASCNPFRSLRDNKGPAMPLPEGQMLVFGGDKSDPSCCPSTYTDSRGCICATEDQMEYLNERGGNRTTGGVY